MSRLEEIEKKGRRKLTARGRFYQSFREQDGCWIWTGYSGSCPRGQPRGRMWFEGRLWFAHRASWVIHKGPIPDGLKVCHRCDNPICVNPEHLFLGTQLENVRDCIAKGRFVQNRPAPWRKCKRGHEMSTDNVIVKKAGGRQCKTCANEKDARRDKEKVRIKNRAYYLRTKKAAQS